jgi:RNA polymerase sigma-70 factor, ECF subfamily
MNAAPWKRSEGAGQEGTRLEPWPNPLLVVSGTTPIPEIDLLRRMAEGDTAAVGVFYDLHAATLFALACRILRDADEAEDVLQDVFLQVWDKAALFDPAQGRPLAWVLTLTRHKAIDRLRTVQRRRIHLLEDTKIEGVRDDSAHQAAPAETAEAQEQRELVRLALGTLPAAQRRAIELVFFDGLTQTEAATVLNEPLGTIKARIRRGMLTLRKRLTQYL